MVDKDEGASLDESRSSAKRTTGSRWAFLMFVSPILIMFVCMSITTKLWGYATSGRPLDIAMR